MRILIAIYGNGGARLTGPEIRGWAMARELARHHDVTAAVHDPSVRRRDGLRLVPFRRGTLLREGRRHDVVICPVLPPYLVAALRGTRTLLVCDQYDPVTLELSVFADQPGIPRAMAAQRMVRELQLRFADVVVVAGERQRALALSELGALCRPPATLPSVVSVPFGLPAPPPPSAASPIRDRFPEIGPDDPIVLWWGKVWKWFDARTALEAMALVARTRPDARLVISAGKAPNAAFDRAEATGDAREYSRELGLLGRNVFFLDEWTPYDCRQDYLRDADVGLTLHADTPEAPFAARARYLDYLWSGLPCVLASGDEVADRFGAAGFARIVPPGSPRAAAQALLELIGDAGALAAARDAGTELAEAFRWPALVEPLLAVLEARAGRAAGRDRMRAVRSAGRYYALRTADHAPGISRPG